MSVPHEITLIAWSKEPIFGRYSILDIVETSLEHSAYFIAQFQTYDNIHGYSQHLPNEPIDPSQAAIISI